MKLRTKLVALSLLTLFLPWSGWKLLQELEGFLREMQQGALLASARTMVGAMPMEFRSRLLFLPELYVPLRTLQRQPALDGYSDDWPDAEQGLEFTSDDGELSVSLLAGNHDDRLFILFNVNDASRSHASPITRATSRAADGITLLARSPRGLLSFVISPEAPGPLQLYSERGDSGQVEGYWLDRENGYRLELALPASASNTDISFQVQDVYGAGSEQHRVAGPLADPGRPRWISLAAQWQGLSEWFARSEIDSARTWLLDTRGWVLADSGPDLDPDLGQDTPQGAQRTTWLQRLLYRLVAGSRPDLLDKWSTDPVRLNDEVVGKALSGEEAISWTQDMDTAVVWNTVAVPVVLQDEIKGTVVMQSTTDGLLLVTNRALGRLLFTTLALTFGLAAGLWYFATRLSQRVQRLSGAVSLAMEDGADPKALPLRDDRDELGELARNNQKLLRAVADYSQYLQTLAGKLSHELKTPLAITRSSLDNLASQGLDGESRRFLERAQEGVDRQAAIIRAMSEASRLEASIGVAEWENVDLAGLVRRCAEGYRAVHPGRKLLARVPEEKSPFRCAPELLAQALDKLVDNAMSMSGEDDEVTMILRFRDDRYELAVRNTGSRLPDELQERLFDSLVSLREKRGAGPHLGLGLYIVRLVAVAHNGSISARNLPDGEGVEFLIVLPV
jgi:two-component system sensor histidine kinase ChvG